MKYTIWHNLIILFFALYGIERMGLFRKTYPWTEADTRELQRQTAARHMTSLAKREEMNRIERILKE